MAHEITKSDNMVFAGETPWHRLGVQLPAEVKAVEALELAGLGWLAESKPIYIDSHETADAVDELDGHRAIVRSDNGEVLGVVSDEYVPLQNALVAEMADALAGAGNAWIHTAGSLRGGQIVWFLLRLPGDIKVKGDKSRIEPYCLLSNAHDGTRAMRIKPTSVRVVCANTHEMAMRGQRDGLFVRHTSGAEGRFKQAKESIAAAMEWYERFAKLGSVMNATKYTEEQMRQLAMRLAGEGTLKKHLSQVAKTKEAHARGPISLADVVEATKAQAIPDEIFNTTQMRNIETVQGLFCRAETGTKGRTAWDAYNATTDWLDHRTNRGDQDARAARSWFGADVVTKQSALEMILGQTGIDASKVA